MQHYGTVAALDGLKCAWKSEASHCLHEFEHMRHHEPQNNACYAGKVKRLVSVLSVLFAAIFMFPLTSRFSPTCELNHASWCI